MKDMKEMHMIRIPHHIYEWIETRRREVGIGSATRMVSLLLEWIRLHEDELDIELEEAEKSLWERRAFQKRYERWEI
jgi:hypothetical protein